MAASKNKHSYRSPRPKASDQTTTKQEHPDRHTHTHKPQANQMTSLSECKQRCPTGHTVHTHTRGLDALPIHFILQNHPSAPPPKFSLELSDLSQQQNRSDTGPVHCQSSLELTGMGLVLVPGHLKDANRQLQAWLPLPTCVSASLKGGHWQMREPAPKYVSPKGAFLHKREEIPAGYFQRRKVLKTEASHPLRYLTLVP